MVHATIGLIGLRCVSEEVNPLNISRESVDYCIELRS